MEKTFNSYKEISEKILEILNNNRLYDDSLDKCFDEREVLINNLIKSNNINDFRKLYKESLHNIDRQIQELLEIRVIETKKEIMEYRISQSANFNYVNINKLNLNIFSKKV